MPETITQPQPSDKLVPIDTSGNSVDVTLNEDLQKGVNEVTQEEAPSIEVIEDTTVEGVTSQKENKEEDLEEYSAGVKKRIDKLTKKMREAERREHAAIEYAKNVNEENKKIQSQSHHITRQSLDKNEEYIATQEVLMKNALQGAIESQDAAKQMEAQQEISKLAIAKERLKLQKGKFSQQEARMEQKTVAPQPWDTPPQPQPTIDPRAEDWAQDNKWFGTDRPMTYTAMSFHEDLVNEGFDVSTEEYYNEINKRIRKEFPHKFGDKPRQTQKVASAVRTSSSGRRTVRLTPSQVAISKKLGVPLEEYAKHVKEA
jgi:hypothetical protein|tara:strand:+ start:37 stop:981 length:945 start_codon:yes stop_codon:yes gene_type:complete